MVCPSALHLQYADLESWSRKKVKSRTTHPEEFALVKLDIFPPSNPPSINI